MAVALDLAIRQVKKADWRGNQFKEKEVRNAIRSQIENDESLVDSIFDIVKAQSGLLRLEAGSWMCGGRKLRSSARTSRTFMWASIHRVAASG